MADIADQVRAEADALAQDMERAATLAGQLAELIAEANASITGLEEKTASLFNSATEQLHGFETKLGDRAAALTQGAHDLHGQVGEAANLVGTATQAYDGAHKQLDQAMQQAIADARSLETTMQAVSKELSEAASHWAEQIAQGIKALDDRVREGEQTLSEFGQAVTQIEQQWRQFVSEMEHALQEMMHQAGENVSRYIEADMGKVADLFRQNLHTLVSEQLTQPLNQLQQEAIQAIAEELTRIADEAIAEIEQRFNDAMDEITGANDKADVKQKLMHELVQQLKPVFQAIEAQMDPIKSIASAVGVGV